MSVEEAMATLKEAFKADDDYAWTWHCNMAVCAQDEGLGHQAANRAAARFMSIAFDVDVTRFEQWKYFEQIWVLLLFSLEGIVMLAWNDGYGLGGWLVLVMAVGFVVMVIVGETRRG